MLLSLHSERLIMRPFFKALKVRIVPGILFAVTHTLVTTGCIIIPIPVTDDPYELTINGLEIGVASKGDVIEHFGDPDGIYSEGSELIYSETAESWKIAYASLIPLGQEPFRTPFDAGVETINRRYVLSIRFDSQEILSGLHVETAGDGFGDCTKSGVCLGEADAVMRLADAVDENQVKTFPVSSRQCSIYLHGPGKRNAYQVNLNSKVPVNLLSSRTFIHWMAEPGRQRIVISPNRASLDFDCHAGAIVFVHFDYHWTGPSRLQLEDQATGRGHIMTRRLALLPTGSLGPPLPPLLFQGLHDNP